MEKEACNIVWLKRDLRFQDHMPLKKAEESDLPVLICYFLEPSLVQQPDHNTMHWRFIYEALQELNNEFKKHRGQLYIFYGEVIPILTELTNYYEVKNIYAHQETGVPFTFERDKNIISFCKNKKIGFEEFSQDGVQRAIEHRLYWQSTWERFIFSSLIENNPTKLNFLQLNENVYNQLRGDVLPKSITNNPHNLQRGGVSWAQKYLSTFLQERAVNYMVV